MKRTRWIAATAALLLAGTGCVDKTQQESKSLAYQRWYKTRAKMLYGVGKEHLRVGQLDRAKNKAREALSLDAENLHARMLLGKVHIEKGEYPQAVTELARTVQQQPKSDEAVYLLAVALERADRFEEALTNYRRAYALNPKNVSALQASAEVLVAMGRLEEAGRFIEGYLVEAGDSPAMSETAGRIAMMQKRYDRAAEHLRKACDLADGNVAYLEALARAEFMAGQYEQACGSLKSLTRQEGYAGAAWVYTMLGDCYVGLGNPRNARDAYQVATERRPEDPGAWVNLAKAALDLGDMARAMLSARRALELAPNRLDATITLGYAMIRGGQAQNAVDLLARAAARHQKDGMLQCVLGWAYAETGNAAQARLCYQRAVQLEPNGRLARELLAGRADERDAG